MERNDDILASMELGETAENTIFFESEAPEITEINEIQQENLEAMTHSIEVQESLETDENHEISMSEASQTIHESAIVDEKKSQSFTKKFLSPFVFLIKYITTSACIFWVLLVVSNYSAYMNLAYSFLYAEEMERTKNSLIESVAAASIDEEKDAIEEKEVDTFKQLKDEDDSIEYTPSIHSLSQIAKNEAAEDIDLGIDITPYENRIIIPKIGKNIPLVDIKQKKVDGLDELNNIFMKELENGVIRYPGSGIPGKKGNSFIFGHSSNFPWMKGDYNDVFSLLDHVEFDDEIVVYYGQEKHTYKIRTKNVISPGDVSVLKNNENDDRSQVTLMTCWPIGTTLNRLVLTGDLISVEK